jgi:hypothetical protein
VCRCAIEVGVVGELFLGCATAAVGGFVASVARIDVAGSSTIARDGSP